MFAGFFIISIIRLSNNAIINPVRLTPDGVLNNNMKKYLGFNP